MIIFIKSLFKKREKVNMSPKFEPGEEVIIVFDKYGIIKDPNFYVKSDNKLTGKIYGISKSHNDWLYQVEYPNTGFNNYNHIQFFGEKMLGYTQKRIRENKLKELGI